jgi:hypothetical protein
VWVSTSWQKRSSTAAVLEVPLSGTQAMSLWIMNRRLLTAAAAQRHQPASSSLSTSQSSSSSSSRRKALGCSSLLPPSRLSRRAVARPACGTVLPVFVLLLLCVLHDRIAQVQVLARWGISRVLT